MAASAADYSQARDAPAKIGAENKRSEVNELRCVPLERHKGPGAEERQEMTSWDDGTNECELLHERDVLV